MITARPLLALLLAVATAACGTTATAPTPDWVRDLVEPTSLVPVVPTRATAPLETPSRWDGSEVPRGVPSDLTRRLSGTAVRAPASRDVGRSAAPAARPARESQGITVNVNAPAPARDDEPAPDLAPPSMLENLYGGSFDREADRRLVQFGYDYFSAPSPIDVSSLAEGLGVRFGALRMNVPPKLAALLDVVEADGLGPVPADYEIGPGDELVVTTTGSFESLHRVEVDREGAITLPGIGVLPVSGTALGDLRGLVHAAYSRTRREFEVDVSLGRLREIRVHVVGHVEQPGLLNVPAHATVVTALLAARGVKKSGSLRRVQVRAADGGARQVDLYRLLVDGARPDDGILRPGDVIHVPPIGETVAVAGYAQRPGVFELVGPTTVDGMIALAGGLTPFTFTPTARLERTVDGRGRETLDIALDDDGRATPIRGGELLLVGAVDTRHQPLVAVTGEVVRPGSFQFRSGMRVSDLIRRADGLTVKSYLTHAFVSRQVGESGGLDRVTGQVRTASTRRVLVVNLERALDGDPRHDVELRPLDHVTVQSVERATTRPEVTIIGAVKNPGSYELTVGLRVSDLIALAGNLTPRAYADEAELVRHVLDDAARRMDVVRYRIDLRAALDGIEDPVLEAGDQLVVRELRQGGVRVRVEGEVRFPGTYVFPEGARITDLMRAAGGFLPDADLRAARFTRTSVAALQRDRHADLTERTRRRFEATAEEMLQVGRPREGLAAQLALLQTRELLDRQGAREATGRIVIPFTRHDFPSSPFDLVLENGDALVVPRRQNTVAVLGHVFNPTAFVALPDLTVEDLIRRAGGVDEYADEDRVYLIRADGEVRSVAQRDGALPLSAPVLAGDVVLVPRAPLDRALGDRVSDVLLLARQMAEVGLLSSNVGESAKNVDFSASSTTPGRGEISDVDVGKLLDGRRP